MKSKEVILSILNTIPDPEIPVLSVVELGVVRDIEVKDEKSVRVSITPTYSGCPAMKRMEDDIRQKLSENGFESVEIQTVYHPAWTTAWIGEEARKKLEQYGIAPPLDPVPDKSVLTGKKRNIRCPRCKSEDTEMVSQFGSTACKALYRCKSCGEPFDYFKCI